FAHRTAEGRELEQGALFNIAETFGQCTIPRTLLCATTKHCRTSEYSNYLHGTRQKDQHAQGRETCSNARVCSTRGKVPKRGDGAGKRGRSILQTHHVMTSHACAAVWLNVPCVRAFSLRSVQRHGVPAWMCSPLLRP